MQREDFQRLAALMRGQNRSERSAANVAARAGDDAGVRLHRRRAAALAQAGRALDDLLADEEFDRRHPPAAPG